MQNNSKQPTQNQYSVIDTWNWRMDVAGQLNAYSFGYCDFEHNSDGQLHGIKLLLRCKYDNAHERDVYADDIATGYFASWMIRHPDYCEALLYPGDLFYWVYVFQYRQDLFKMRLRWGGELVNLTVDKPFMT